MNNQELYDAIALTYQFCAESYKLGSTYAGSDLHKSLFQHLKNLLGLQLDRARIINE